MKKNIGIVTLQGATNYGAVLQAYALQEYLKKNGNKVEIINFYDNSLYGYYSPFIFARPIKIKTVIGKIIRYKKNKIQFSKFETFRKNRLQLSPLLKKYNLLVDYAKKYDVLVVGSDQVWNANINCKTKDVYYLNFSDTAKKYSYAASSGNITSIESDCKYIDKYLNTFNGISVRENDLKEFLKKHFNINTDLVCDPTLLLSKEEWLKISEEYNIKNEFILVYMLNENENMIKFISELIQEKNMKVINIGKNISATNEMIEHAADVSPSQFIYLYNKASYIVTNSFHGTAFSLIFEKKFITFGNGKLNSRMDTLLKSFKLGERFINDKSISFNKQMSILEKSTIIDNSCSYVERSKEFINMFNL